MRLTIESGDSIETVLAVVGALYKVELGVQAPASSAPASSTPETPTPAASAPEPAAAPRGRRRSATPRAPRAARATPASTPAAAPADSAAIRSWARANGVAVSPRGRIPASVQQQFEAAQA